MKIKTLLLTFTILCAALITGCENDEFEEVVGLCPIVESTTPLSNALNVPLGQVITATFNEQQKLSINMVSLKRKHSIFLTPLNLDLNVFILALNDSAEALVLLLSK